MNEIPSPAAPDPGAYERLQGELEELRRKLAAAEGALQAARGGEPDVVAAGGDRGQSSSSTRDRLLANSIDETRQAFAAWRPDGSLILANRAARELLGYEEGEMHGLDWQRDLIPPDQRPTATVAEGALRRGDRPAPFELELARKDGSRVPVRILVHAERDASGRVESYCMFWIEATRCRDYEQALLASEAFYRPMVNHMFNGIAYCRMHFEQGKPVDWSYLEVNAAFEELVGLGGVVGRRASEAIPGLLESNPELLDIYTRVASVGKAERFEMYVHAPDMWFSAAAYCPRPGYFAVVFDVITERKPEEGALRRSEEKFRTLFETMAQRVIYEDAGGRVIDANPAAERILGLSREQLLRRDPRDYTCSAIHLDGRAFAVEDLPTTVALRTGTEVLDVMLGVFNPTIGRTCWLSISAMPLFEATQAVPAQVYCTLHDVTEKLDADRALAASEARFRACIDWAAEATFVNDSRGRFVDVNQAACRSLGYTREELLRLNVSDVEQDIRLESVRQEWTRLPLDRLRTFLGTQRRKDRSTFPVEIRFGCFEMDQERYYVASVRDLTERRDAEMRLEQRDELLRMTSEIAMLGGWEVDALTGEGRWTEGVARIHDLDPNAEIDVERGLSFYTEECRPRIAQAFQDALTKGVPYDLELEIVTARGVKKQVRTNGIPVVEDGRTVKVRGIVQDISERKRTEQSLRESQERLEAIVNTAADAIITIDEHSLIYSFNPAAEWIFGYRADEIVGQSLSLLMPEPIQSEHSAYIDRYQHTGEAHVLGRGRELVASHKDGSTFPIEIGVNLIQVQGRRLFVGILRDISERKAAEREIRALNASLEHRVAERTAEIESMVNHAAVGLVFFDRECRILRINEFFAGLSGIPVQDHVGRHPRDVYPPAAELVEDNVPWVFATGEPLVFGEFSLATRPGEEVRTFLINFFPVRHGDGSVSSVGVSVADITFQKRGERELARLNLALNEEIFERERAEQQLRRIAAILESAPDFVAMADPEFRVVYFNQAAIRATGWAPGRDEFVIGDAHPSEVGRFLRESALPTAVREGVWRGETDLLTRDGRRIPVSQVIVSHLDAAGSLAYYSTIMRDMTEYRALEHDLREHADELARANAELARASQLKDEFLANMSHELRTPLNGVLSMAQALEEEVYGPVNFDQAQAIQDILSSGRHLLAIISDILDLTRIEADTLEYLPGETEVAETCQAAVRMIAQAAKKKHHRIEITRDPAVSYVVTDERRLKQILVNLLSNAVKFTPEGGSIGLEVHGDAVHRRLRLTVRDTGIGIAAADLGRIFEPFTQVDSSLSRQFSGAGLGLALVKRVARLLGGDVTAESEPGRGSRFTLELDWVVPSDVPRPDEGVSRARPKPVSRCEEILENPEAIADFLATQGISTMIYPHHATSLVRIVETRPRLVLIDTTAGDAIVADLASRFAAGSESALHRSLLVLLSDDKPPEGVELPAEVTWLRNPVLREDLRLVLSLIRRSGCDEIAAAILTQDPPSGGHSNIVLLAEDDAIDARSVLDFLQTQGLCLALARDGEEAVHKALELLPRAILMDVHLPGLDGLEAIRRIRSDRATAAIPIIALTAPAAPGDRERCLAAGADAYVAKPFVLRELLSALGNLLHGQNGERRRSYGVGLRQPDPHR